MKFTYRVFLVFFRVLLFLPMHLPALDHQNSPPNSTTGNLAGPFLTINKIPVHCVHQPFNVTGTTSLPCIVTIRIIMRFQKNLM